MNEFVNNKAWASAAKRDLVVGFVFKFFM